MINEKNMVVQGNPPAEAQYKLGEIEQKLLRVIISMVAPETTDLKNRPYRLYVQDFSTFLGHQDPAKLHREMRKIGGRNGKPYQELNTLFKDLLAKGIQGHIQPVNYEFMIGWNEMVIFRKI